MTATTTALADVKTEAAALQAMKKAQKDFVGAKYGAGIQKLQKALKACGTKKCSDEVRADLLRDIGAQQFRKGDKKGANKSWAAAYKLMPSISLSATYDSPDVRQAFEDAGGGGSRGGGGGGGGGAGGSATAAGGGGAESTGSGAGTGAGDTSGSGEGGGDKGEKADKGEGGDKGDKGAEGEKSAEGGEAPKEEPPKEEGGKEFRRIWLGVSGTVEFGHLPAGQDLCRLANGQPANNLNYYCTYNNGSDFPPRNDTQNINGLLQHGQAGNVSDQIGVGNIRVMLAFDYAVLENFLLGARLGVSFLTYPGTAAANDGKTSSLGRLHAELRATYLFGQHPLGRGIAPLVFVAGGVSEFDQHASDNIVLQNNAGSGPVQIWRTDGPLFLAVGAGIRLGVTERFAFTGAIRGNFALSPVFLPTVGPEIGLQVGF
jgi:hypothetical protein